MMMIAQSKTGRRNVYTVKENGYRFGFNGMEKDDEVKGVGNSLNFGARIYDTRLGRWLSVDPDQAKYTSWSPYCAFNNSPILMVDPSGKGAKVVRVYENGRVVALKVVATIYVYSTISSIQDDISNHARNIESEINAAYNVNATAAVASGDNTIQVPVTFEITVIPVGGANGSADADRLANGNTDASNNYVHLNENPTTSNDHTSITEGNTGDWSIHPSTGSKTRAHEFAHFLGWSIRLKNGTYFDHPTDGGYDDSVVKTKENNLAPGDLGKFNYGGGLDGTPQSYVLKSDYFKKDKGIVDKYDERTGNDNKREVSKFIGPAITNIIKK
jgi:RHS repeat-associated protein